MLKAARVAAEGRELSCENANRGVNNPEPSLGERLRSWRDRNARQEPLSAWVIVGSPASSARACSVGERQLR
jgi:hypothetical protein